MTSTDRKHLAATLAGTYVFYDRELSDLCMRMWAEALDGIDNAVIDAAFSRHLRDPEAGRFCPKPADILRQIYGDAGEQALIAWGEVIAAAKAGGARFGGAAQDAIESMGGMGRLRMASEAENGFLQRQFVAAYKAFRSRAESPPLLQGDDVKRIQGAA
ncbi:MAG: hypothetical protein U1F56_01825 [Rubrivivax sp.]